MKNLSDTGTAIYVYIFFVLIKWIEQNNLSSNYKIWDMTVILGYTRIKYIKNNYQY